MRSTKRFKDTLGRTYKATAAKRQCSLCLRQCGLGLGRVARLLDVGKASVSRWLNEAGVKTDPNRNGVALKGTGIRLDPVRINAKRMRPILLQVSKMRQRAKKCLSRKGPRESPYPIGLNNTQKEAWRYYNRVEHRLRCVLRRRIRKVITHGVKRGSSLELLGCTEVEFRIHIENQFELGMTWSNYGQWELDHRRPCASFDLTKQGHQRACFRFTNYRPMWKDENISKSSLWKGVRHGNKSSRPRQNVGS